MTGKTWFFMKGPVGTDHLFVLTLASDLAVLYGNDPFSIYVLSIKKYYSSFFEKRLSFSRKSVSDLKY